MPTITFDGQVAECESGDNLRRVLMEKSLPLYNGVAALIHCRGMGTCGTCAVSVEGEVSPMTKIEHWRLGFPPHKRSEASANNLRLACQYKVLGDLKLKKLRGMWGSRVLNETDH